MSSGSSSPTKTPTRNTVPNRIGWKYAVRPNTWSGGGSPAVDGRGDDDRDAEDDRPHEHGQGGVLVLLDLLLDRHLPQAGDGPEGQPEERQPDQHEADRGQHLVGEPLPVD